MDNNASGQAEASHHESLCRRCGVSCHLALPVNGVPVVIAGLHCKYLAPTGSKWGCQVYQERFERAPWCYHANEAGPQGFLAHDCPYTRNSPDVRGKVRLPPAVMDRVWPAVFQEIQRVGLPDWIDRAAFTSTLQAREGGRWGLILDGDSQRLWPQRLSTGQTDSERQQ